jgi:hypothetical protein
VAVQVCALQTGTLIYAAVITSHSPTRTIAWGFFSPGLTNRLAYHLSLQVDVGISDKAVNLSGSGSL